MRAAAICVGLVALCACSKGSPDRVAKARLATAFDVREAEPADARPGAPKVSLPQIAYTYSLGFRLAADRITAAQQAHVALCDRMGPARCHIVSMTQSGGEHGEGDGTLTLQVAAGEARRFGDALVASVGQAGGETVNRGIEAEDLSKQIIDTEAHLRAKQALADRLVGVLRTRQGSVADLVAAERAVADTQEEIDAARSELADAQGRVALSTYRIDYSSSARFGGSAAGPLSRAWDNLGDIMGSSLATLLMLLGAVLPWAVVLALVIAAIRLVQRRRRPAEPDPGELA